MPATIQLDSSLPIASIDRTRGPTLSAPSPFKSKPEPQAKTAWLASAGYGAFRVTKHSYVHTVQEQHGWAFIFECSETKAKRRFGLEAF